MIGGNGPEETRLALANAGPITNAALYNNGKALWDGIVQSGALTQANATVTPQPVGALMPFAGSSAPAGWLLCGGQAVSRTTYSALFAVVGTTYGVGDGSTTFNVPDLRGRVLAGKDDMGGTAASRLTAGGSGITGTTLGAAGGSQTHTLTVAEMPSHSHQWIPKYGGSRGTTQNMDVNGWGNDYGLDTSFIGATGGSGAHQNTQPTIVANYIIKAIADPVNTIGVALAGSAGGDLTGSYPNPTVTNITNAPIYNSNTTLSFRTSNTERMSIDASGRLRLPYQPAFSGRRVAGGYVAGGVFVTNVAAINRGNHYNTSNGIFTCPVAGAYYMGFQGIASSSPGYGYIRAYKNGINQGMFAHYNLNAGSWNTPSLNAIIDCAANDQLTFVVETIAGNAGFYGSEHNTQSIMLLG